MASTRKSPRKSAKLPALKPRTVRMSVATRIRGGVEPAPGGKNPKSPR